MDGLRPGTYTVKFELGTTIATPEARAALERGHRVHAFDLAPGWGGRLALRRLRRAAQDKTKWALPDLIVIDGGKIVAEGKHDSLVAEGGLYAELAKLQFTDG